MTRLLALRARLALGLGATLLIVALAAPAAALGASAPIILSLDMYSPCVAGRAAPNAAVNVVWRFSDGGLKLKTNTPSSTTGVWQVCASKPDLVVLPMDRIKVDDGTSSRTFTVPNLTMAVDRVSDDVTGTGPAGRTLHLCPSWRFSDFVRCHSVRIAQDGTWLWHANGGIDGAWVDVDWSSPNNDDLHISAHAQSLTVTLGKAGFFGEAGVAQMFVLTKLDNGTTGAGATVSDGRGEFAGQFVDSHGDAVKVAAGDHVMSNIASDADWIMPVITATADRFNDTAAGYCEPTATATDYVEVTVMHSGHYRGTALGNTDGSGNWTVDFRDPGGFFSDTNIITGDRLIVNCFQQTGDVAQLKFIVS